MRIVIRLLLVLVALVVLGLVSLVVLLPRLAGSSQVRDTIEQASTEALGRPLQYGELSVGILPPRIELSSPRIAGATADAAPLFVAERVDLRIALLPLLRLVVLVDSLVVDGPEIEVIRTAEGFELPMPPASPEDDGAAEPEADEGGVAMAVRSIQVRNGRVTIVDRSVAPAATIGLDSIGIDVHGVDASQPIEFEGQARFVSGGEVAFAGRSTLDGVVDLQVQPRDVVLTPFSVHAGEGVSLDGTLSGEISVRGPASAPESLTLALNLALAGARSGDAVIDGPLVIQVDMQGDLANPSGTFSIDASGARVTSVDVFDKPAGVAASLSGRFAPGKAGATDLTLDRLVLASLIARGRASVGDTVTITLDADPFELDPLRRLVSATVGTDVQGTASLRSWKVQTEPLSLGGEIVVERARASFPGGGGIDFKGRVVGQGSGVDWVDFDLATNGQHFAVSGKVRDVDGRAPFSIRIDGVGVLQTNDLLTGLDPGMANVMYGPMTVAGEVSGVAVPGTGERDILDLAKGFLDVDIGRTVGEKNQGGRIVGFAAMGTVASRLEQLGEMARITTIMLGGRPPDLSSYTGEAFDWLDARLRIHDGLLDAEHLRINYVQHSVDLKGTIELSSMALDLNGEVQFGSVMAAALGAKAKDGEITVRLAHVGGTLDDPKVEVSKSAIASLTGQLVAKNATVGATLEGADVIVPGSSRLLEKAVEGVLNSGKKKKQ